MPVTIEDISITHELSRRFSPAPDYLREKMALQELAQAMSGAPDLMLSRLVSVAKDVCDASSAGISVLEGAVFRWVGLAGKLTAFNGTTTPRNFSPCGVC